MKFAPKRRSERIDIVLPIQVLGSDAHGRFFTEKGRTSVINRDGAVILLRRDLIPEQELTLRCLATEKEAEIRVVGRVGGRGVELAYGVALIQPEINPWGVRFPELVGTDDGTWARIMLQCVVCKEREVLHLNETDLQLFEATRSIQRPCNACSSTTPWKQESNEAPTDQQTPLSQSQTKEPTTVANPTFALNKRKHMRIQSKSSACIRQSGFRDEIVKCEDISRGGLSFKSRKKYLEGSQIEVAIPYSTGSGNIFVPARIAHVRESGNWFKHGAAYCNAKEQQRHSVKYEGTRTSVSKEL